MKKNNILKTLALVGCAIRLVAVSIAGTMAYMTSKTGTITNTFTVGQVNITMDEAVADAYGAVADPANRANITDFNYKLIPGRKYVKDPTIRVTTGSEQCYLFVEVNNGISAIEVEGNTTIEAQMTANGWTKLNGTNVWYHAIVDARNTTVDVPVFGSFTIDGEANTADYASAKITVTAYAVQADGFNDAADAWAKTFGKSGT